jgi:hypothetical protein
MPQVFKMGPYLVYFWSNENEPLEPVHVHISQGVPSRNSTKVWLTKNGGKVASCTRESESGRLTICLSENEDENAAHGTP